jgi:3-oxoacyl-[acyl-carrier-protein] synthase III
MSLPACIQSAEEINAALGRPAGWLQEHAGIESRRLWREQDPLVAAADAGRQAIERAGLKASDVSALLVTSEAPPLFLGLAANLHHRLKLSPLIPALEIGNACTGFLAALWTGRQLMYRAGAVLIIALEAPSRLLKLEAGTTGEVAALFGDGAAACLLCDRPAGEHAVAIADIAIGADGSGAHLLTADCVAGSFRLRMDGKALTARAIRVMAEQGRAVLDEHGVPLAAVTAIIAHGGNGRMPALLARKLGVASEQVWSETARLGNLGSATLPAAWAARAPVAGPVLWTAVGAGLTWATALMAL